MYVSEYDYDGVMVNYGRAGSITRPGPKGDLQGP